MKNDIEAMFYELIKKYIDKYDTMEQEAVKDILNNLLDKNSCEMIYWYIWNLGNKDIFQWEKLLYSAKYQKECATISMIARELYNHYQVIDDDLKQKLSMPRSSGNPYTPVSLRVKKQVEEVMKKDIQPPKVEIIIIENPGKPSEKNEKWREHLAKGIQGLLAMDMYDDEEEEPREYCGICQKDFTPEEYDKHMFIHTEEYRKDMEEADLAFDLGYFDMEVEEC